MYKKTLLSFATLVALNCAALADTDWYRINNLNTLITARRGDLEAFMALNRNHQKSAVRALYNLLLAHDMIFNIQPGTDVQVVEYFTDGTARIEWSGGQYTGYIAKADLSRYLGSE
jgi:hypothetical protein